MPLQQSTLPADVTDWPEDYFDSAKRFVHLARLCNGQTESHQMQARGPDNEILSVDVAAFISPDDEYRIIIVSGVHGVEGYLGAAVQMQFMKRLAKGVLPDRIGVVIIHAANPWGYAHSRRVDENNVDVNRNFVTDFSAIERTSKTSVPQYAELDPVINASQAPGLGGEIMHWLKAGKHIVSSGGIKPLFGPIAQGQYEFPKGLFYGGARLSESCAHLQVLVKQYSANARRVSVLDVHSGLGPSGIATLIGYCNSPLSGGGLHRLEAHLGKKIVCDSDDNNSYNAQGTFSRWCYSELKQIQSVYLCIEIGTVNPVRVFSALRRENQAHHWGSTDSRVCIQSRQALRDVFSPPSKRWRDKSVSQALGIIEKIINLPAG